MYMHFSDFYMHFSGQACNFIKIETLAQVFSSEFCEISKDTFSYKTPTVAAFGITSGKQISISYAPCFNKMKFVAILSKGGLNKKFKLFNKIK